jgi:hypothetical protein
MTMMTANELLNLTADVVEVLRVSLLAAETMPQLTAINNTARGLSRYLDQLKKDESLKSEIHRRADICCSELLDIAHEAGRKYEVLLKQSFPNNPAIY